MWMEFSGTTGKSFACGQCPTAAKAAHAQLLNYHQPVSHPMKPASARMAAMRKPPHFKAKSVRRERCSRSMPCCSCQAIQSRAKPTIIFSSVPMDIDARGPTLIPARYALTLGTPICSSTSRQRCLSSGVPQLLCSQGNLGFWALTPCPLSHMRRVVAGLRMWRPAPPVS
jgi:hypothetical protein